MNLFNGFYNLHYFFYLTGMIGNANMWDKILSDIISKIQNYWIILNYCHWWNLFRMVELPLNFHSDQSKNKSNGTKFHKKVIGTKIITLSSGVFNWGIFCLKQNWRAPLIDKWVNLWVVWIPQDKTSDYRYIWIYCGLEAFSKKYL